MTVLKKSQRLKLLNRLDLRNCSEADGRSDNLATGVEIESRTPFLVRANPLQASSEIVGPGAGVARWQAFL